MTKTLTNNTMAESPLAEDPRRQVAQRLQTTLAELIDLALQGKQAHWNVTGPRFRGLHDALDEIVDSHRGWSDTVAERMTAIGVNPSGQARGVAETTTLPPLEDGWIDGEKVVEAFVQRLADTAGRVRDRAQQIADLDPVSEHALVELTRELEEQLWMMRASR